MARTVYKRIVLVECFPLISGAPHRDRLSVDISAYSNIILEYLMLGGSKLEQQHPRLYKLPQLPLLIRKSTGWPIVQVVNQTHLMAFRALD